MKLLLNYIGFVAMLILISCGKDKNSFDATGVFEATETIVSAESSGKILQLNVTEGDVLQSQQQVGLIDPSNLELQKSQLEASLNAIGLKKQDAQPQVQIIKEQLNAQMAQISTLKEQAKILEREKNRLSNLVQADAIPTKQFDDVSGQLDVLRKQIAGAEAQYGVLKQQIRSQEQQIGIVNRGILSETQPMKERIEIVKDQIGKTKIMNPVKGTVLVKYAESNEFVAVGKPLYKLGDTENMFLRAYISGDQLTRLKLGQDVKVFIDKGKSEFEELSGKLIWISEKAEFTPKTIQTKDERSNLVYAIKIAVKNNGNVKMGMYGEVKI
jgi:HlyD family secretion protein